MSRALLAGVVTILLAPLAALAQEAPARVAIVVILDGSSLHDLLAVPELRALASRGGAALMNGRRPLRTSLEPMLDKRVASPLPLTNHGVDLGRASPAEAAEAIRDFLARHPQPTLAMVVSASPSVASAEDGDELGTVIAAWGDPTRLLEADGEPRALTSDSTRRAGVVATEDPAATVAEWLDLPSDAGSPVESTGEPAPLDLYRRYLQQRRLAVPIAAGAWGLVALAGLAGVLALAFRNRVSDRTLAVAGALAASLPWLALALLMVGHLPSLTYASVIPFLLAVVLAGVASSRVVATRRGITTAIAATGAAILVILAIEAVLGWPAALTPLAGGGQLDGGRFYGMPNIEIGLVLGCALYVAQRIRPIAGMLLLAGCGLVVGSPWFGSNAGAAITLSSAAGLWLGVRRRKAWWWTASIAAATTAIGMALLSLAHRYLTPRPTHVSAFLGETAGIAGILDRLSDRLGIGLDLLAEEPFALVPVVGTMVVLLVILRPPTAIARSFEGRAAWRDALLAIALGSIVAYVANDTGAAALGFGFGTALSGMLDVSVRAAREKMGR